MPALRRSRYLTCFYCGQRTSTPNDGRVRHFECPNCEATNYLDENGEITDPPVQAMSAATEETYTVPRPGAASRGAGQSGTSGDVFCDTCLKNQQLFTRSLAQYLPDDPDDPEYEERERNYYAYRKGLEKHYPQVCAECEPRVIERITQAGYTAKTDHLRRMIDRSREVRITAKSGLLDAVAKIGRSLWVAGFVLQALWHLSMLHALLIQREAFELGGQGAFWGSQYVLTLGAWLFAVLPSPEKLVKWSIVSTAASVWWNPHLVKTVRGFTKHLIGLPTWYTYQATIMFVRILALGIPSIQPRHGSGLSTQMAAHAMTLFLTFFLFKLALASVRTDTTPLFAATPNRSSFIRDVDAAKPQQGGAQSMADILDEVLAAPPARQRNSPSSSSRYSSSADTIVPSSRSSAQMTFNTSLGSSLFSGGFDSLNLSEKSPPQQLFHSQQQQQTVQYDMEMDWTPTQSKHRAFNIFGAPQQPLHGFGRVVEVEGEGDERRRQFWYKVPPAPTSIARRALNPPQTARLRKQTPLTEDKSTPLFGGRGGGGAGLDGPGFGGGAGSSSARDVAFKEASFFYDDDGARNDPRNSLSDMFGKAFTISPTQPRHGGGRSARRGGGGTREDTAGLAGYRKGMVDFSDVALLALSLMLLLFPDGSATFVPAEYAAHVALAACCLALVVWARVVVDTWGWSGGARSSNRRRRPRPWASLLGWILCITELALLLHAAYHGFWAEGRPEPGLEDAGGGWFVGALVAHQVWNLLLRNLVLCIDDGSGAAALRGSHEL